MKIIFAILFVMTSSSAVAKEDYSNYFKLKKMMVGELLEYKNDSNARDEATLKKLEIILIRKLNPPKIKGYNNFGITLQTLQPELGFNQLDGLITNSKEGDIFFTSMELLKNFNFENSKKTSVEIFDSGEMCWKIFSPGAACDIFGKVKTPSTKSLKVVAFLTIFGQDVGPFPPNALITYLIDGENIIVFNQSIDPPQIKICEQQWKSKNTETSIQKNEEKNAAQYRYCYFHNITAAGLQNFLDSKSRIATEKLIVISKRWNQIKK
jgi:hypothetical protein